MAPRATANNMRHGWLAKTEPLGERSHAVLTVARCVHRSDIADIIFRQVCLVVRGTTGFIVPTLGVHVLHVLGLRPEEQVVRVDTGRVIPTRTVVAHIQTIRDRAVRQLPRHPVSAPAPRRCPDDPIPVRVLARRPQPASMRRRRLIHLLPEPIRKWTGNGTLDAVAMSLPERPVFGHALPASTLAVSVLNGILGMHVNLIRSCAMLRVPQTRRGFPVPSILSPKYSIVHTGSI